MMKVSKAMKWHHICYIIMVFIIFPYNAVAWNNADAHMEINRHAFEFFELYKMPKDSSLKNTCLCGENSIGSAWDKNDGVEQINQKFKPGQNLKTKNIKEWIIQGGFSADEPEGPMALRHFYDPLRNSGEIWITDQQFLINFLNKFSSSVIRNPQIDAKTWAIDYNDRGDEGKLHNERIFLAQDYSWYDAKKYFILALAEDESSNKYYGMAWRSVGETMHMVSDMTLPAHVRNDGHAALGLYFGLIDPKTPIFGKMLAVVDPDPIEYYTDDKDVRNNCCRSPSPSILYDQPIDSLMKDLALWTNKNFLSKDTIPVPGQRLMANGYPVYMSPNITGIVDKEYIWHNVDRKPTRLVHVTSVLFSNDYNYDIDSAVKNSQNALLIPTAIRASETVLDRFLPRFSATMQIQIDSSNNYMLHGELKFDDKYNEWLPILKDKRFKINNGAYVVINGKRINIPKQINGDYTEFTTKIDANPGDTVYLEYDFGGYVIESEPYHIPESVSKQRLGECICDNGERIDPRIPPMGSSPNDWWYECYDKCLKKCGCTRDDVECIGKCF